MHARATFGQWGEDEACRHLESRDYKIICRNYRCRLGEIDIIACKNAEIVFVEVKTRKTLKFGIPAEAVTKTKQAKIHATALHYLQDNHQYYKNFSFDVIEIVVEGDKFRLNHIPNCF